MSKNSCEATPAAYPSSTAALHEAPIQALAHRHQQTLARCSDLHVLTHELLKHGPGPSTQSTARDLLSYFDTAMRASQANEVEGLFPALIESMAGSDAVCLRGMTEGLSDMLHRLDRCWRTQLRPLLLHVTQGESSALPVEAIQTFNEAYAAYAERCGSELLPMAERLLSDAELERLAQAMERTTTNSIDC